jgi:hypothetical protein
MISSLLCLLLAQDAFAVPLQMNHQGRLLDSDGSGLTGSHELIFRIFDDPENGYEMWTETQTVNFINGYYSVLLGADEENNALDDSVFANYPLYLELKVDGENLEPRHQMASVPYAQIAGVAESVDGGTVNASEINVGGQPVINSDGQWVGEAATVDFMNLQNRPPGLDDGDDNTQLSQTEVVDYVNGSQVNLGTASQVDGSDIITAGSFNGYFPTDIADGDNDLLASISCAVGEIISWDGNASWVCVSDATLELADIENMLANNPMDLNAATTIGGLDIVTSIDDSDTLASLSCQNDGEIARYDLVLDEWYCDPDIDTDTVLDQAGVLAYVNGEALSLASGTQVNGSDVVTVDTFTSNLPSDLADGDADTQLDQAGVLGFVDGQTINLGAGTQLDGNNIVLGPSLCSDGQVIVYNSSSHDWECGNDTDSTLTPTEVQTMIEALTLNLQNVPQVNGENVLLESSILSPSNIDTSTATEGQVLTMSNNVVSWASSSVESSTYAYTLSSAEDDLLQRNNSTIPTSLQAWVNDNNSILSVELSSYLDDSLFGTGSDGSWYVPSSLTTLNLSSGVYEFTDFNVRAGVTVEVVGTDPLIIYSQTPVTIDGDINLSGYNASGSSGGAGRVSGSNGGNGTGSYYCNCGGSDGGYNPSWNTFSNTSFTNFNGGSGGSGGCGHPSNPRSGSGGGAGAIFIAAPAINISGSISAEGGNDAGCGGNGAGGSIWLRSSVITTTGDISVSSPGGNDGKIRYDAHTINDDAISEIVLGIATDIQKPHHISYNSGDIYIRNNTETIQEYTIKIIE